MSHQVNAIAQRIGFAIVSLFFVAPCATAQDVTVRPRPSELVVNNPLMGWCPYPNQSHQMHSMVFLYVPWKTLEPQKGVYQFEQWESDAKRGWAQPGVCGKRIVFRILIDYPGKNDPRFGLPDWLKAEGVEEYDYQAYGGGRSPQYDHPKFIEAAERLITAMGRRYNDNPRIAFVQLGLLGHWGEWHVTPALEQSGHGIAESARAAVVDAFHSAFPDKQLMCRNANDHAGQQPWLGFHDDLFPTDTLCEEGPWCFLKNLRDNGRDGNWSVAPFGGEMEPGLAYELLSDQRFATTIAAAKRAHFTWMGPYCPASEYATSQPYQDRCETLLRTMGYRFQLTEIRHRKTFQVGRPLPVTIQGSNLGVAPFYYRWPLVLSLIDRHGHQAFSKTLDIDVRQWSAESKFEFAVAPSIDQLTPANPSQPYTDGDEFRLCLGIIDPWKGMPGIQFANELPVFFGWTELSTMQLVK